MVRKLSIDAPKGDTRVVGNFAHKIIKKKGTQVFLVIGYNHLKEDENTTVHSYFAHLSNYKEKDKHLFMSNLDRIVEDIKAGYRDDLLKSKKGEKINENCN